MHTHLFSEEIHKLLVFVDQSKATDLHLCAGSKPLIRVDSLLESIESEETITPEWINSHVVSYLENEKLHYLEKNKSVDFSYSVKGLGRYRCNIYMQRGSYAVAIRALPLDIPSFEELGIPSIIEQFAHKNKGLVLVTGPSGSGKSTTLAGLINIINQTYPYHVITIEDPLEYLHRHQKSLVTQREIGSDAHTFADALRAALREDPDVIMLGEMRDLETMSIAMAAAETGHLVFSTLHTLGAVKTVDRIIDAFPNNQQNQIRSQLCSVLEGIVSQELIPQKEHKGLVAACEVMTVNPAVRNLIREGKQYQINNMIQSGSSEGMISLERSLAELYQQDRIDEDTARISAQDINLLNQYIKTHP